jgi:membrane dipeptidase
MTTRLAGWLALVLGAVGAVAAVGRGAPGAADQRYNRVQRRPVRVSERARRLHSRLAIADLHADSLLWGRDLAQRNGIGHVDLPRLIEGQVALQVFSTVTQMPGHGGDPVLLLAQTQGWPAATHRSLKARVLFQAQRLQDLASRSGGRLTLLRSRSDLAAFLAQRQAQREIVAGLLSVEGAHALEGDPHALETFDAAGVRMIGLAHFFDNAYAGSAHGSRRGGLTPAGRELVRRMEARRMIVDLAHASPRTIDDVLAIATRPVVVSHTGLRATCDNERNLSDAQVVGIARRGGLIGIGYWRKAVCGGDAAAIAGAIREAVRLAGVDHVALGSDFVGAVTTPFDAAQLVELTEALLQARFTEAEIEQIEGANALRFLAQALP